MNGKQTQFGAVDTRGGYGLEITYSHTERVCLAVIPVGL